MTHTPTPIYQVRYLIEYNHLVKEDRVIGSVVGSNKDWLSERITSLLNACEGMEDPAKEIAELKARVKELEMFEFYYGKSVEKHIENIDPEWLRTYQTTFPPKPQQ